MVLKGQKDAVMGRTRKGTIEMDGSQWLPLQLATSPTPLFPDSVSGRSAYSAAAAARILELWTRSDNFAQLVMLAASSSKIEPGITPNHPITLQWDTFTTAADEAGISRRHGDIHFRAADLAGRLLGR